MIDKKDFLQVKKELADFDEHREALIKKSRDLLRDAKKAIYLIHRNDIAGAKKLLAAVEKENTSIKKQVKSCPKLDFIGAYSAAIQEYVEAMTYLGFVEERKIPSCAKLGVRAEDYLLGLCDLTGELGRRAVHSVIRKEFDEVHLIKKVVDEIFGLFLELNLRNGELRKKSDAIKWNLKKIEDIVYDLETKR